MIVMNWVKHMIYTADAYAPIFLTNVLQAALFGLGQDPQGTLESIRQAPYLAHYFSPPPELVRKDSHAYVMQDVAWYFHRADFTFLSAGILFFRWVSATYLVVNSHRIERLHFRPDLQACRDHNVANARYCCLRDGGGSLHNMCRANAPSARRHSSKDLVIQSIEKWPPQGTYSTSWIAH